MLRFALLDPGGVATSFFASNCFRALVFNEGPFAVSRLAPRLAVAGLAGVAGVASKDFMGAFLRLPGLAGFEVLFLTGVWVPFGMSPLLLSRKDAVRSSPSFSLSLSGWLVRFDFEAAASCGVDSISSGLGNWKECAFFDEDGGVGFVFLLS
jgi:hypothetical protein